MNLADIFKYILEGLAVAVAAYFIPQRKTEPIEIVYIAITAAATFMILDLFAPSVSSGARQGTGFGIGLNQVGWQAGGYEGADGKPSDEKETVTDDSNSNSKEGGADPDDDSNE